MTTTAGHEYAVVMRMEGMFPADIGGFERHRTRKGGDLGHVDRSRSHLNDRLLGKETWAQDTLKEIREMAVSNFADELEALQRRKRKNGTASARPRSTPGGSATPAWRRARRSGCASSRQRTPS